MFYIHIIGDPEKKYPHLRNFTNLLQKALEEWVVKHKLYLKFKIMKLFCQKKKKNGDTFENINISLRAGSDWTIGIGRKMKRVSNNMTANIQFGSVPF